MAESILSSEQIVRLAQSIPVRNVEKIALRYFDLSDTAIANVKADKSGDAEAQSRDLITKWAYKNPDNQLETLAQLLYKAAEDGDVNPLVVKQILKINKVEAKGASPDSGVTSYSRKRTRSTDKEPTSPTIKRQKLTSENVRDLARQFVSIGNISELGTIGVDVKERIIEATLMGDIDTTVREAIKALSYQSMDRLDTIVKEVKEIARPQRSTKRRELTAQMKHTLATLVNTVNDLRELGIMGFGVDERKISAARTNNNDNINEAARVVISTWSDEYDDPAEAFEDLCKILRKIKKNAWIKAIKDVSE